MDKETIADSKSPGGSNWYLALEAKRRFAIGSVLIICIAILVVMSLRNPVDYDNYWHLQMGKDLVENGLSPFQDHYSFTYQNETVTGPPVLFQMGLYGLVKTFGEWGGFFTIKLLAFLLVLGCMLAWLKQIKAPVLVYCLVLPMLVFLIQFRAQVRPELISFGLSIIALMLYKRADLRLTMGAIAPIALFLLFWINYHSPIIGYVIFFGLFVDIALKLINEKAGMKTWLVWAGWGVLLVGVGFINPSLSHPVYGTLTFPEAWKSLITEYRSPLTSAYLSIASLFVMALFAVITLILAIRQRKLGYLVIAGVMLYAGSTMARMVAPTSIVILGLFAHVSSEAKIHSYFDFKTKKQALAASLAALVAVLIPIWDNVFFARNAMFANTSLLDRFPKHLVAYMLDNDKAGRIFNEYEMGGYLIHRLSPGSQVYIDGRTGILYPLEHFKKYALARNNSKPMATEIDQYAIDFAVLKSTSKNALTMLQTGALTLDFVDAKYALYSKESAAFPATGALWARPYCWSPALSRALSSEWQNAQSMLPAEAPVVPLLALAAGYGAAEDPVNYLSKLDMNVPWDAESMRFAGYRALEHGLYDMAIMLFRPILAQDQKDYLALALAHTLKGQFELAEQVLVQVAKQTRPSPEFDDLVIIQGLLTELQQQHSLSQLDRAYIEDIFEQVGTFALSEKGQTVSVESFCSAFPQTRAPQTRVVPAPEAP